MFGMQVKACRPKPAWRASDALAIACVVFTAANDSVCMRAAESALDARVTESIRRGADYLTRSQHGSGAWNDWGGSHELGVTALAGLALVAAGSPANSPAVQAAARMVRGQAAGDPDTYDVSLAIMFLDRLSVAEDEPLIKTLLGNLQGGQCGDGSWTYALPIAGGGYGQPPGSGDNSNTQFAALAIWIGRRHGRDNDASILALDKHFRGTFIPAQGGWGYGGNAGAGPAMTCAGLVALATQRGADQQRRDRIGAARDGTPSRDRPGRQRRPAADDPIAKAALAALGGVLKQADQWPGAPINADLYFFWSLERVGVIYDLDVIGGVNWYDWGSRRLLMMQGPDGQWHGQGKWKYEGAVATSFAILFLSRANVAGDLTSEVGAGRTAGADENERSPGATPGGGGGSLAIERVRRRPVGTSGVEKNRESAKPPVEPSSLDPR
jgi:hypothetical protein